MEMGLFQNEEEQPQEQDIVFPDCGIAEGIYFNMPEETYHAAKVLSCSNMKKLLVSQLMGWHILVNPKRKPEEDTPGKEYGKASHRYILEPETFNDIYCFIPDYAPRKPSISQINAKNPSPESIKAIQWWEKFLHENEGKKIAKADWIEEFQEAHESLQAYPDIRDTFKGGYPEVSIFLKKNGIMFKCRIDYLKPGEIDDLKTFSNSRDKTIDEALKTAIIYEKYNFQHFVNVEMLQEAIKRLRKGTLKVFGDVKEQFLHDLASNDNITFNLVFQESSAPHEVRKIELYKASAEGATPNQYWTNAEQMFQKATDRYIDGFRTYGLERWIGENTSYALSDEEIPNIVYQQY